MNAGQQRWFDWR